MIGIQRELPVPHSAVMVPQLHIQVKAKMTGKGTLHNIAAHTQIIIEQTYLCNTRKERLYSSKDNFVL